MNTTVHINDDLFTEMKDQARQKGASFKQMLNLTLRKGIEASKKATLSNCFATDGVPVHNH